MTPRAKKVSSRWLGVAAVAVGAAAAYANSFKGAFVFDDDVAVLNNPTIRSLWPISRALSPPNDGSPVSGRPFTNVTFALDYALRGQSAAVYHATSLTIHVLAGLLLFGIVACTLGKLSPGDNAAQTRLKAHAISIAAACAVLWTVHPLQTESVTYTAQRSEELMGFCYLLTLFSFIRATGAGGPAERAWLVVSWIACLAGMAAKEVMVTAPLLVLVYDATFVARGFGKALTSRRRYYLGLGATWILLAYLALGVGTRGGTIGFGTRVAWSEYAEAQFEAVAHYLRLCVWPHPLVIDYGRNMARSPLWFAIGAGVTLAGVFATVMGLRRHSATGFLGVWFFGILAPTSSVIPVATEIMAEHRMYLPLAAVVVLAVTGLYRALGGRSWPILIAAALTLIRLTQIRNDDYRSALSLWGQTVENKPDNAGAHNNLGAALLANGKIPEAVGQFDEAVRLDPSLPGAHSNLGAALSSSGHFQDAVTQYESALELAPRYADARVGLANALAREGRSRESLDEFDRALSLSPDSLAAHLGHGTALLQAGRFADATAELRAAVTSHPDSAEAHNAFGFALSKEGQTAEAEAEFDAALRLKPDDADADFNLGNLLVHSGRVNLGIQAFAAAVRLAPQHAEAQGNLGGALLAAGRPADAIGPCETAVRLDPKLVEARVDLGNAFAELKRYPEAVEEYRAALSARPDYSVAHHDLAVVLHALGDDAGARAELELEATPPIAR